MEFLLKELTKPTFNPLPLKLTLKELMFPKLMMLSSKELEPTPPELTYSKLTLKDLKKLNNKTKPTKKKEFLNNPELTNLYWPTLNLLTS